jgi:hypothetical protein
MSPNRRVIGPHRLGCKECAGDGCAVLVVIGERIQPGVEYRPPRYDEGERDGTYYCADCKGKPPTLEGGGSLT